MNVMYLSALGTLNILGGPSFLQDNQSLADKIDQIFSNMLWQMSDTTKNIVKTPKEILGADFWNNLLRIGTETILPFGLTILSFCIAMELYNVWCRTNGKLELELVSNTFFHFMLPFLIVVGAYPMMDWIFTMFNDLVIHISSALMFSGAVSIDTTAFKQSVASMEWMDQLNLWMEMQGLWTAMKVMTVLVTVVVYGRLFEIVICWLFAPIPLATLVGGEWSRIGKNFIKTFCALLLQGAIMEFLLVVYIDLVNGAAIGATEDGAWQMLAFSAVLIFTLMKSGRLAKRILDTF